MKKFLMATLITSIFMACNSNDVSVEKKEPVKMEITERVVTHEVIVKGEEEVAEQTIRVAATSDVHGRIYPYDYAIDGKDDDAGLAKVSTVVNSLRAENPNMILMDDGDTVQDNSSELFNDLEVHPMVEAMNSIGYDIWTLGNHEFNFEKEFIERNISNFNGTVLSANIKNKKDGSNYVNPYQIFNVNGARVAVIGVIPPYVPMWESSSPSHFKGLEFNEILESVQETVKELDGQYDILVGSFHMGREDEYGGAGIYDLANKVPEFDVIFGGHEHAKYVENINNTPIVEPGFAGWAVSKADIHVKKEEGKWVVKGIDVENIQTKTIEADQKILDEFKYVDDQAKSVANTVIGEVSETFITRPDFITGEDKVTTMPTAQLQPNAVIDLINDVQLKYAGADVSSAAFFKAEANLKAGNFHNKDVANIYKYANTLVGVNMTGENLLKFMEWSMSYYNTWNEGDVTISFNEDVRGYNYDMFAGVNYKVDLSKDAGNRVVDPTINGEAIDPAKIYKVAVNNYRFGTLTKNGWVKPEDKYYDSYETMQDAGRIRDLIIKYTKEEKNGKLDPIVHNNWEIIGVKLDYPERDAIYEMIREGKIVIPRSADGRTVNVKSINLKDYVVAEEVASYTVKTGDTLGAIANKFDLKVPEILKENKNIKDANIIRVGEELIIPAN
ncbi:5'-nucleotidase C-terminal domain-containing protein [Psychrilyobacter atlanticus]|uniref:5'-nucleotidase C-terminal domain-containing protein n=1 Tax=Psychrilyobacter atlanticus TaxID=271091 RepID=UPI0004070343|nr:5'-nucleotidase C-terminal domain-containing protein [Psychrilyobacter atlanticus]